MTVENAQTYVFNESSNAFFMRTANMIAEAKIHYDKAHVKQINIMRHFCTLSEQCLGKDYKFLQDGASTRLYIRDVFGAKALRIFENNRGEIFLDIEHALVFYYWLRAQNSPHLNIALGILYFIAAHQLDEEFEAISKVAPKNQIKPIFELSPNLFRWKRCNYVLRKYMLALSVNSEENEKGYYYEMPSINQIGYLLSKGFSLKDAKHRMENTQGGLFYSYIPRDIENMLLPSILSGDITSIAMDGYFTQSLIQDFEVLAKGMTVSNVYNVYTQNVKPILVDMMGILISAIQNELHGNPSVGAGDVKFYHIAPTRLGLAFKENIPVDMAVPSFASHLRPVKPLSHYDLLAGEHLF